jgi:5-methylcytosine-specific restriction endonuclease McrA
VSSRAWPRGSTYAWRKVRARVLDRDRHQCQMPTLVGLPCLAPATTVDHIIPVSEGGAFLDTANLRAACARHNHAGGAAITNGKRRNRAAHAQRRWSW